jgi:DMSO/TMAO reductase YedYZ heme-binding membrane subunit
LRNRRYLGLAFAVSHLVHAVAILLLLRWDAALFWTLTKPVNIVTGGLAYAFILAMAATSFDRTAAWLGRGRWRVLHRLGVWYIWVSFLVAFGKRIPENGPAYWLPVVALIAALALRLAAARRRRPGHQPA